MMWSYIWPIALVVVANTFYNLCAKQTPAAIAPFAALTVTYLTAAVCSVGMFFLTGGGKSLAGELHKINWSSFVLGVAIVGLEFGFICVYRAGWKVSVAPMVATVALTCVLLLVGFLLFRETLTARQLLGMAVCIVGMLLIGL